MLLKKLSTLFMVIIFICTTVLTQFAGAQNVSQATVLEDLEEIEMTLYGQAGEGSLIERVEYLEKELVGRTLPGTIGNRVKQLKEFIIDGTPEDLSVSFKIKLSQWILEERITSEPILKQIESLENTLFGEISDDVLAMRAENIFEVCFKDGKPQIEEVLIPAGTLVPIRFLSDVSSKKNKTGDTFAFEVAENIYIDGKLILPANHVGTGEVVEAKKAKILSRKGKLELAFKTTLALDGTVLNLVLGEEAEEENERIAWAIGAGVLGLIVLSNPIGLAAGALIPGKNVKIEEGSEMYLQVEKNTKAIIYVQ